MTASSPSWTTTEPGEETLAGLWSFVVQELVGRGAHEVNNALNGAVVNVEVVKARSRPGVDGGAAAPFAEAAGEQLEALAAQVEALLWLARTPKGTPDVAMALRHTLALLGPTLGRRGVAVELAGPRSCPTGGDPVAMRLAVVSALLAIADSAARMVETAGMNSADEPTQRVRCIVVAEECPTVELAPRHGALLPDAVLRVLSAAGVLVSTDSAMLRIALPGRAGS